ncbi:MAG: right-handed parallel beta-helix repeat-containing protein [Methanobrevibacter sp.]|nr:right-handed parallel beta-helix repeat-containing protein [Methanobrevibacter sp.]
MNKKAFVVVLLVLVLFSLNFSVAHEIDNTTSEDSSYSNANNALTVNNVNKTVLKDDSQLSTKIDVRSNTTFDVIGDYFKIKLSDENGKPVSGVSVAFTLAGTTYYRNTSSSGFASLQLILNDGTYKITTKFLGNSNYKASSITTTITMNNTRVVEEGLSNAEIQKIIDNAKAKNVILFEGSSYSDINLVINKRLTLISNVNTALTSSSQSPVIQIRGSNASQTVVKGFNIRGEGNGIRILDSDYVKVLNNDISANNGIVATGTKYLNITNNNLVKNAKAGIVIGNTTSTYIFNNKIVSNGGNGIEIAKSNKVYIHGNTISNNGKNGIYTAKEVNGVNYGGGPENIHISKNDINKNTQSGIYIKDSGDNVNIKGNVIEYNSAYGISITNIGNNVIQSNVISHSIVGVKFNDDYLKPKSQDISSNVIHHTSHVAVEARDTYYYDFGEPLQIGDNWYTDDVLMCPKVRSNNMQFKVTQIGPNQFQATFYDSKGNIASLLPDRILEYQTNNGEIISMPISGGTGTFTVDASNGDIIKATVDSSHRDNTYNGDVETSKPTNGVTPTYEYPSIDYADSFDSYGGNGNGNGDGSGGNSNGGSGSSNQGSSDNTGNSTHSQNTDPGSNSNNPINDAQNYETDVSAAEGASTSSGNTGSDGSQSVVKQIIIEEDDIYRVTGISFIVLLIILTIGLYYRDDIKEMNSKR